VEWVVESVSWSLRASWAFRVSGWGIGAGRALGAAGRASR